MREHAVHPRPRLANSSLTTILCQSLVFEMSPGWNNQTGRCEQVRVTLKISQGANPSSFRRTGFQVRETCGLGFNLRNVRRLRYYRGKFARVPFPGRRQTPLGGEF